MTKIIVILSVLVVLSGSPLANAMDVSADFYVAADGIDRGPGTFQKPFATLPRAQTAVRRLISNGLIPVVVQHSLHFEMRRFLDAKITQQRA